jgi:hypothetical protein
MSGPSPLFVQVRDALRGEILADLARYPARADYPTSMAARNHGAAVAGDVKPAR